MRQLVSRAAEQTIELGRLLAGCAPQGLWLGLSGDLGAGKTTLVKGLARGAGVPDEVVVNSPTFVIIQSYPGRVPVHHLDFYRLSDESELYDLDYFALLDRPGWCAVEWWERLPGAVPDDAIKVELRLLGLQQRQLAFQSTGPRSVRALELFWRQAGELGLV